MNKICQLQIKSVLLLLSNIYTFYFSYLSCTVISNVMNRIDDSGNIFPDLNLRGKSKCNVSKDFKDRILK